MRKAVFIAHTLILLMMSACASIGIAPAESFTQRLAYAYATQTAVLQSTTQSLEAGEIGSEDAVRVLAVADKAREALDAAKLASGVGDLSTAEARLNLAVSLLSQLQSYLRRPQ